MGSFKVAGISSLNIDQPEVGPSLWQKFFTKCSQAATLGHCSRTASEPAPYWNSQITGGDSVHEHH